MAAGRLALQLDPWNSQYLRTLVRSRPNLERAAEIDPYNALIWRSLVELRYEDKDLTGAWQAAKRALEHQPMRPDHYLIMAQVTGLLLDHALVQGEVQVAQILARDLVSLGAQLEERRAIAAPRQHLFNDPPLEWTPEVHLATGKGLMLTDDLEGAEEQLQEAVSHETTRAEALLWLHALQSRRGDDEPVEVSRQVLRDPVYKALMEWK